MPTHPTFPAAAALLLTGSVLAFGATAPVARQPAERPEALLTRLPLNFEANQGQTDPQVRFLARGSGYALFLTPAEATFRLRSARDPERSSVLKMGLIGANASAPISGERPRSARSHYFRGRSAAPRHAATFAQVRSWNVYPGVDLLYYGRQRSLEYDFLVRPGAETQNIRWRLEGAEQIRPGQGGDLTVSTGEGALQLRHPVCYQEKEGRREPVSAEYVLLARNEIGFQIGDYDHSRPLVIDPVLDYSSYLGGSGEDTATGLQLIRDITGAVTDVVITGATTSVNFPTTVGSYDHFREQGASPDRDLYVARFNSGGANLIYSTYLGGTGDDLPSRLAVDLLGSVYVTGQTRSRDFPTTFGAFDRGLNGASDAFLTKLNPDGDALVYSSYLGGQQEDRGTDVVVNSGGQAFVSGVTNSANFPTANAAQANYGGGTTDGFVAGLSPTGTALVFGTFLGGGRPDEALGLAVDVFDSLYVTGWTLSSDFPTTVGAFQRSLRNAGFLYAADAFVVNLDSAGGAPLYATYLGGTGIDIANGIAVDNQGSAYLTGSTQSADFPVTSGAADVSLSGTTDAFVAKLDYFGYSLSYATYLGGTGADTGLAIALNSIGQAYVAGSTLSTNFPTPVALQPIYGGKGPLETGDGFVVKLNGQGSVLHFGTYFGGSDDDAVTALATGEDGELFVAGSTRSGNFSTTFDATQTKAGGGTEAFLARLSEPRLIPAPPLRVSAAFLTKDRVSLQWEDHSTNEVGFQLERKVGDAAWTLLTALPANTSSYEDRFIAVGGSYRYRVRAYNDAGNSAYGESDLVRTPRGRILVPKQLNFKKVVVGQSKELTLFVENTSRTEPLLIVPNAPRIPFLVNAFPATLPPGGSFGIRVLFAPSFRGKAAETLTLTTSDPANPVVTVRLIGTAR